MQSVNRIREHQGAQLVPADGSVTIDSQLEAEVHQLKLAVEIISLSGPIPYGPWSDQ